MSRYSPYIQTHPNSSKTHLEKCFVDVLPKYRVGISLPLISGADGGSHEFLLASINTYFPWRSHRSSYLIKTELEEITFSQLQRPQIQPGYPCAALF